MKPWNMLLAGVGGQGILFVSKVFFEAATARGRRVTGAETHGMSQRGGSVVAHFRMGEQMSTMVIPGTADVLVGLDRTEALRNLEFLRPGGIYLVNAPDLEHLPNPVRRYLADVKARVLHFDADGRALAQGKPLTANLYLVGYLAARPEVPFEVNDLCDIVARLSKPSFSADNLKALNTGYKAAGK
ncbi:MAG: 2-oxoacid:acceptor oxidoreductase family protein [Planctomycetota bacterium]|jgi:indolepyruvate ferredoxin oxidoreductase beta subunit